MRGVRAGADDTVLKSMSNHFDLSRYGRRGASRGCCYCRASCHGCPSCRRWVAAGRSSRRRELVKRRLERGLRTSLRKDVVERYLEKLSVGAPFGLLWHTSRRRQARRRHPRSQRRPGGWRRQSGRRAAYEHRRRIDRRYAPGAPRRREIGECVLLTVAKASV